ncbi:hypothetical protein D3C80_1566510 [compost metagenome]
MQAFADVFELSGKGLRELLQIVGMLLQQCLAGFFLEQDAQRFDDRALARVGLTEKRQGERVPLGMGFQLLQFAVESAPYVTQLVGDITDFSLTILVLDIERENVCHCAANAVRHIGIEVVEVFRGVHYASL